MFSFPGLNHTKQRIKCPAKGHDSDSGGSSLIRVFPVCYSDKHFVKVPALVKQLGLIGRALDWVLKGCWFETHCPRSHCVMSLSKT